MFKKILTYALCLGLFHSTPVLANDHAVGGENSDTEWTKRKGMRFGYNYAHKADESDRLESSHMFAIGFETQQTMTGVRASQSQVQMRL